MPHLKKGALKDFMKIIQDEGIYDEKSRLEGGFLA